MLSLNRDESYINNRFIGVVQIRPVYVGVGNGTKTKIEIRLCD